MRERMWIVFGIGFSLLLMSGCGGGGGGGGGGGVSDTTPPVVSSFSVAPSLMQLGGQATAEAEVVDVGSGVANVSLRVRYPNGEEATYFLQRASGDRFSVSWDVPNITQVPSSNTTVSIVLIAVDRAGNRWEEFYLPAPRLALAPPAPPQEQ